MFLFVRAGVKLFSLASVMRELRLILAKLKIDFLTQEMKEGGRKEGWEVDGELTYSIMHPVRVS